MKTISYLLILLFPIFGLAQEQEYKIKQWVASTYESLSLEERIGQLFMVAAYSNRDKNHLEELEKLIKEQHIGGVIFFQGGPVRQAKMTNRLQEISKVPLFVGIDGEWGLSMRLDSTYVYPWNMTLGAVQDLELLSEMGKQVGQQSKRMGVHFTFAPVVDVNTNPVNPVIGVRSYGETKEIVASRGVAYTQGLQSQGVWATAKHFPGHGDTSTDSHHTLPRLTFEKTRIENLELYPFQELIRNGLASIMVGHLEVPALEEKKGLPTSLSYATITDLLKNKLGFKGLVFTDALNMKGVANYKSPGLVDLDAFLAGNDVLLFPENVPLAIDKIKEAYEDGRISEERLSHSVKKILYYKYLSGLHEKPYIDPNQLVEELHLPEYDVLNQQLYQQAMTLLRNKKEVLPLSKQDKVAYVKIGDEDGAEFVKLLQEQMEVTVVETVDLSDLSQLNRFDKIIIGYHKKDGFREKHDFNANELELIRKISEKKPSVLVAFCRAYSLKNFEEKHPLSGLLLAFQNNKFAFRAAKNILFAEEEAIGKLPVTINESYKVNHQVELKKKVIQPQVF